MSDEASSKFTEAEISPQIIPVPPKAKLNASQSSVCPFLQFPTVQYSGKPSVEHGTPFHSIDARHGPKVTFEVTQGNWYSLVMIDPDNLSRESPSEAEWLHWLIVNAQSDTLVKGTMPKAIMGYTGPSPMPRTGQHRYVFLLYDQGKKKITQPLIRTRAKFKVREFAEKHNLGNPVAGNYFLCEHDD